MNDLDEIKRNHDLAQTISEVTGQDARYGRHVRCPFHADSSPSLMIYPDGHWHCFGCGLSGDLFDFLGRLWFGEGYDLRAVIDRIGDIAPAKTMPVARRTEIVPTLDPALVKTFEDRVTPEVMEWWRAQGIPAAPIYQLRIGHTGDRHTFPWFYRDILTAFKMRRDDRIAPTLEPKYTSMKGSRYAAPYNIDAILTKSCNTVLICEDEKSVLAALVSGMTAIATPANTWKEEWCSLLAGVRRVVIVPDNDAPGLASAEKIKAMMRRAEIMVPPMGKDLYDLHQLWRQNIGDLKVVRLAMRDWLGVKND